MTIKTSLELLNEDSVTVMTTRIFEYDGQEFATPPHAQAYINDENGIEQIKEDLPEPFLTSVLAAWGVIKPSESR